jgi:hypothetical protein
MNLKEFGYVDVYSIHWRSGGLLGTWQWIFGFFKRWGISFPPEGLSTSPELCPVGLASVYLFQ